MRLSLAIPADKVKIWGIKVILKLKRFFNQFEVLYRLAWSSQGGFESVLSDLTYL